MDNEITREFLAKERPFSDLMEQLEKDKRVYSKCAEITERHIADMEQKKELLRSAGLLDDY